ncbi:hypothetical protein ACTZWT_23745 [Rhodopseudomonas sp. NSM]
MARLGIAQFATALFLVFAGAATAAVPPTVADPRTEMPPPGLTPPPPPARAAAPAASTPAQRPSGNPLWGIPLRKLTASVARPLFAPTRRPPAAAEVKATAPPPPPPPPKPAEKDKPQLVLLGTVAADSLTGIGLFIDRGDKSVVRLRTGENHNGWVLRSVAPRQVVLEKGDENAVLTLPPPDTAPAGPALPVGSGAPVATFKPNPPGPAAPPPVLPRPASAQTTPPPANNSGAPISGSGNPFTGMVQQWMNRMSGQPAPGQPKP